MFGSPHLYPIMQAPGYGPAVQDLSRGKPPGDRRDHGTFAGVGLPEQRRQNMRWMLDRNVSPILSLVCREGRGRAECFAAIRFVAQSMKEAAFGPASGL